MRYTTEEIAVITGGELVGENVEVTGISTDTRTISEGELFIAVTGERFDGNDYIKQAALNGAAAAVSDLKPGTFKAHIPIIYVKDSRRAQLALAREYRERFGVKVCGVTGSVGKTSTKDMISAVLSAKFKTLKTQGNLNNDIGLPKTLFQLDESYQAAVVEMGMSDRGEISELSKTACPNIAVITNIGYCHIENLKTRDNIFAAKMEILDGADKDAPLVIYGDDEYLKKVSCEGRRVVRYGFSEGNDVWADGIVHGEGCESFIVHFNGKSYQADVPAVGEHHILNALAAFCVGIEYGMTPEEIIEPFRGYQQSGMRQKIEKHGDVTFILDCYNASPTSMKSALSVLNTFEGRKFAVLGDMLELGEKSRELHKGIADYAKADEFFLYGHEMKALFKEFLSRGIPAIHSEDKEELARILKNSIKPGDVILFKGSRGMKMEEIAEKLCLEG